MLIFVCTFPINFKPRRCHQRPGRYCRLSKRAGKKQYAQLIFFAALLKRCQFLNHYRRIFLHILNWTRVCTVGDEIGLKLYKSFENENGKGNKNTCTSFLKQYLPSISQWSPLNLTGHEQENDVPLLEQFPPFKHGALGQPKLHQNWKWKIHVNYKRVSIDLDS